MNKNTLEKILTKCLMIFFCLSIILDLHVFYNSISTMIRVILISLIFLIVFIKLSSKKDIKLFILYGACLLIYIVVHHLNALNFNSFVPGNFNYSLINELLYFFKMLSNVMLFYIIYKLDIKYINIRNYIKLVIVFITFSIIIGDLLSLSYTAYNFSNTTIPFFKWFNYEIYDFMAGSSKGFFHLTNQIVAVLLLYLPLSIYETYKNNKVSDYIILISIVLSMLMIGNRLAIYGTIIELFVITIIYLFLNIKNKLNKVSLITNLCLIIGIILIIPYSPLTMRNEYYDAIYNDRPINFMEISEEDIVVQPEEKLEDDLILRLKENEVDQQFYNNSYPYQYDREFWEKISNLNVEQSGNARYIELAMIKRVKQVNNNCLDTWLGLTYTRVMNIFNIERDIVMQYYSIGIIGTTLFIGLYVVLLIYCMIKVLFDLKNKFNELNIALLIGSGMMFLSSISSGNILNAISTIIPLIIILSILVNEVRVKKEKKSVEKILGFNVSTLTQSKIIKNIFKENGKQKFIVNINPFIILDHRKDQNKKDLLNKEEIQIPDGEGIVLVSKLRGGNINKRIAGIDLMLNIVKESIKYKRSIFLYGAKPTIADKTKEKLEIKYPNVNIVGTISGYEEEKKVINAINKSRAEILFVALGSPKQEDFIIRNKTKLKYVKIFMPVGGSYDVISGNLKRAPKLIQKLKLEWLYRMILEPRRLKGIFRLMKFVIISIFDKEV